MTEDEMVERHNRLNGHEFEQVPGAGEGQEGLICCSPCSCKSAAVHGVAKRLNNNNYCY